MLLLKRSLGLLCMITFFTGCAMGQDNQGANERNNNDNQAQPQNVTYTNENNNQTRMDVADEAADKVKALDEVRQATAIVTNRNAYVAVVLDNQPKGDIRRDLEEKISDEVKSTDPDIRNVFVSANPDFVDRMTDYGDKIQQGRPIQGLFEEFTEMTQRIFPNAR